MLAAAKRAPPIYLVATRDLPRTKTKVPITPHLSKQNTAAAPACHPGLMKPSGVGNANQSMTGMSEAHQQQLPH